MEVRQIVEQAVQEVAGYQRNVADEEATARAELQQATETAQRKAEEYERGLADLRRQLNEGAETIQQLAQEAKRWKIKAKEQRPSAAVALQPQQPQQPPANDSVRYLFEAAFWLFVTRVLATSHTTQYPNCRRRRANGDQQAWRVPNDEATAHATLAVARLCENIIASDCSKSTKRDAYRACLPHLPAYFSVTSLEKRPPVAIVDALSAHFSDV
jgi:hypothetical protein